MNRQSHDSVTVGKPQGGEGGEGRGKRRGRAGENVQGEEESRK